MKSLGEIVSANDRAVIREWEDAIEMRNHEYADAIQRANPDLFEECKQFPYHKPVR